MTEKNKSFLAFCFMLSGLFFVMWVTPLKSNSEPPLFTFRIQPPAAPQIEYTELRTAPLEVAKVFGRSQGCENADAELIEETSTTARHAQIDPRIVAATIAVESGCNSFAVSSRGALGLMQIMPKIWKDSFDFQRVNLLNRTDNIRTGTAILSNLVHQYGMYEAVRRYQGLGIGCETCDGYYTEKIFRLAGRNLR